MNDKGKFPRLLLLILSLLNINGCKINTKDNESFTKEHMANFIYQLRKDRGPNARYLAINLRYPDGGPYEIDILATSNDDTSCLYHRLYDYKSHGDSWYGQNCIPYPGSDGTFTLEDLLMLNEVHIMTEVCRKKVRQSIGEHQAGQPISILLSILKENPTYHDRIRYQFTFTNILTGYDYQFEFDSHFRLLRESEGIPIFSPKYPDQSLEISR